MQNEREANGRKSKTVWSQYLLVPCRLNQIKANYTDLSEQHAGRVGLLNGYQEDIHV